MELLKPMALSRGDAIGMISPSARLNANQLSRVASNARFLEKRGYKVKLGKNLRKGYGHNAGTVEERLDDLHSMFEDGEVAAIMASRGGYNSNELLDRIDYGLVRRNPKIFCGFSDITFMHCALHKKTGLVSFYGPMGVTLFDLPEPAGDYMYRRFHEVVAEGRSRLELRQSKGFTNSWGSRRVDLKRQRRTSWKALRPGVAKGALAGGHIYTILNLAGTGYFPDLDGRILFWEDTESTTAHTERYLWQLRMMGVFDRISGMLVGRPNADEYKTMDRSYGLDRVILDATKGYDFPIITSMDFGHTLPMMTLPYGIMAEMRSSHRGSSLALLESAVTRP